MSATPTRTPNSHTAGCSPRTPEARQKAGENSERVIFLNGSKLTEVFLDGRWVSVRVEPTSKR